MDERRTPAGEIARIAAPFRPRWWQRRTAQFEVHYWDDQVTRDALDAASAVAAVTGDVWVASSIRPGPAKGLHLDPDVAFSEALFRMCEVITGVDTGTLHVNVAPDAIEVLWVEPPGRRRRFSCFSRELFSVERRSVLAASSPAGFASPLRAAQSLHRYPPYDDSVGDVAAYSLRVELLAAALERAGWADRFGEWVHLLGDRDAAVGHVRRAADATGDRMTPRSAPGAAVEHFIEAVRRNVVMGAAAARHGLGYTAVDELIDAAVPTEAIDALIDAAYR